MSIEPYDAFQVRVDGGDLHVGRWGDGDRVVVAAHGITGNHKGWAATARSLGDDISLVAPDLRGRGRSNTLPGPYGMRAHARDLAAVVDHLGVDDAVLVGHSMGAYAACVAATEEPGRWPALVLVDGGISLPLPDGVDPDAMLAGVLGPALDRLGMEFATEGDYFDFWRSHPAFADRAVWTDDTEAFLLHDLDGEPPHLRSAASLEAVRADGRELLTDRDVRSAYRRIEQPAVLLRAPRGLLDDLPGLFPDELLDPLRGDWRITLEATVEYTNHYSIVLAPTGAKTVASHISATVDRLARRRG
jgi:pimeloyl-ACP methyl ester carboxylesterase